MPLPVRTASVRTTDTRKNTSRLARPAQANPIRKTQDLERPEQANTSFPEDRTPSDSANGSQPSSRIPSPFKLDRPAFTNHIHQTSTAQAKPPPKGHSRQRSAVLPPLSSGQKFGHSRSISAISVNTRSSSGNDVSQVSAKSRFNVSQSPAKTVKAQPETRPSALAVPNSRQIQNAVLPESLQNELLQLSMVHKESAPRLRAFERSIATSLAGKQAHLTSVRADVQRQKQDISTASNLLAIDSWLQQIGYQKTCQSVQDLSVVVRDLQTLERIFEGEDGLAAAFDKWSYGIANRDGEDMPLTSDDTALDVVFEKELAPELQRFKQRVTSSVATLTSLSACSPDSSMCLTIQGQASLAKCLLSQSQVMLLIGNELASEHRQWIEQEIAAAVNGPQNPTNFALTDSRPMWT